jgi:hypothetical protein
MTEVLNKSNDGAISLEYETFIKDFLLTNVDKNRFVPLMKKSKTYKGNIAFGEQMQKAHLDNITDNTIAPSFVVALKDLQKENSAIVKARYIKYSYYVNVKGSNTKSKVTLVYERSAITDKTTQVTYTKVDMSDYIPYMRKPTETNNVLEDKSDIFSMTENYNIADDNTTDEATQEENEQETNSEKDC